MAAMTLRPVVVIPRDDAWAYTAEHLADVAKALADIREGRVRQLSDDDLAEELRTTPPRCHGRGVGLPA